MSHLDFRRIGCAALTVATLTVCTHAASPDAAPSAADRPAAQSSASLFPELPDDGAESLLPGNRFDFRRGGSSSSGGGEALPTPTVGEHPGARAVDLLDRRRNWIYSTQTPSSFELSAERALGVRSSKPAASSGEAGGWLADFFYDRGPQRPQNRPFDEILNRKFQMPDFNNTMLGNAAPGMGLGSQNGPLGMAPFRSPASSSATDSTRSGMADELGLRQDELSGLPTSIQELLGSPGNVNTLITGFDPINLRGDSTRQEINPVYPDPLADLTRAPRTVEAVLDSPTRTVSGGRPSALDSFNARMLGDSSLAPAVAPIPEIRPQDRPAGFGQFPSRKF
jgi:hypothetical protein